MGGGPSAFRVAFTVLGHVVIQERLVVKIDAGTASWNTTLKGVNVWKLGLQKASGELRHVVVVAGPKPE
jgi:hypothetical protein